MEIPKDQINALLDNDLSAFAQILESFLVSSSSRSVETSPRLKAENSAHDLVGSAPPMNTTGTLGLAMFYSASFLPHWNLVELIQRGVWCQSQ